MKNKQRHEALADPRIRLRNQALDRVGAQLFGIYWFNGDDVDEAGRTRLPKDPKRAAEIAKLQHPFMTYNWQVDAVIHWLQHDHGVECSAEKFDNEKFEKFFSANFGAALSPRQAAIVNRLRDGERPGDGGNIVWKEFCQAVCKDAGGQWDDKTIKREVKKLRAVLRL